MSLFLVVAALFLPPARAQTVASGGAAKEPASLEGRVVNTLTVEPIRKAYVMLTAIVSPGFMSVGLPPGLPQSTVAPSDGDGKFSFEKLEPGQYTLSAEKPGFVRQSFAPPGLPRSSGGLTLAPGERMRGLEFKLTPQAVIRGKVLDEDGEPVALVSVQVQQHLGWEMRSPGPTTDDNGEFQIGSLRPGKYTVSAEFRRGTSGAPVLFQGAGGRGPEAYVTTYYPGATAPHKALPIEVRAGQIVSGIEIRLQKDRVYRVRGRIQGLAGDPASRLLVSLQPQQRRAGEFLIFGAGLGTARTVKPDGSFELPRVQPGSYFVTVKRFGSGPDHLLGRAPVTLTNADLESVIVQAGPPVAITGRIEAEGDEKARITGSVFLRAEITGFGGRPARIRSDGTFKIGDLDRDRHFITVEDLPDDMYVKRARAGTVDVLEHGLDLSQSESAPLLEIVVSPKAATIEGVVRHEGKPWAGAWITLLPEPVRSERLGWSVRSGNADQNGHFTLKGVPPGEYRLYAWEESPPVFQLGPEQLRPYESHAVKIKVAEGSRERVEATLARAPQQ